MADISSPSSGGRPSSGLLWTLGVGAFVLAVLFWDSFDSRLVHFANDGPLGAAKREAMKLPEGFTGIWLDTFWLGAYQGSAPPSLSMVLLWLLGPVGFLKFFAPISLLISGVCAWFCFRQFGMHAGAACLGGLATALNSNFFSNACWGLGTRSLELFAKEVMPHFTKGETHAPARGAEARA